MKNLIKFTAFQLFSLIILVSASYAAFAQATERTIMLPEHHASTNGKAFEIVEASSAGKSVALGKPFVAGDDWLSSLTFKIKNITGKPIRFIRMSFSMPETSVSGKLLGFSFSYGVPCDIKINDDCAAKSKDLKLVMPGEVVEMKFSSKNYQNNQAFILRSAGLTTVNQILIGITSYQLEDGSSAWTQDLMLSESGSAKAFR